MYGSYDETNSFMEEGQFINDEMNGFGRRMPLYDYRDECRIGFGKPPDTKANSNIENRFLLNGYGSKYKKFYFHNSVVHV